MALCKDDCDDEIFEDASDDVSEMDLATAIDQAKIAVSYFFNNKFEEARQIMQPWADRSMYHALGYGTFMYLQAVMTFDPRDIEIASERLKLSVEVCNRFRRKNTIGESIGKIVKKADYNSYTEDEIHAELCYAECLLLRAILTFIEDETMMSFLKGSMKIRACYQSFKECWYILEGRDFSDDKFKIHFESGVRMGVGTFNLLVSQLPGRVLKLLEFVGFTTSRSSPEKSDDNPFGLKELQKGFDLDGSLRKVLCGLVLLAYHTFATYAYGTRDGDLDAVQRILDDQLKLYPNGALFLFFHARLYYIRGKFSEAAVLYDRSRFSQSEWRQFHHICYWELYWVKTLNGDYKGAQDCANILLCESKWSKAIYSYQKAICYCMRQDTLSEEEKEELRSLMRSIPVLKQKIAGKSIPVEKFAVKKSQRFFAQNERLTLASIEFMYTWNHFIILRKNYENIERVFSIIEKEQKQLESLNIEDRGEYYWDNLLLVHLLKGVCLSNMNSPLQAAEEFRFVINNEKRIKEDTYIVPFSLLEAALLHYKAGDLDQARLILDHTKTNFKGFLLESRLHFRIHSTINRIKTRQLRQNGGCTVVASSSPVLNISNDCESLKISRSKDNILDTSLHNHELGYKV